MVSNGGIKVKRDYLTDVVMGLTIGGILAITVSYIVDSPFVFGIALIIVGAVTGILIAEIIDTWQYLKGGR